MTLQMVEKRSTQIMFRLTPAEKALLEKEAARQKLAPATFVRSIVLQALEALSKE